jgi:hypothetical protein
VVQHGVSGGEGRRARRGRPVRVEDGHRGLG